MSYGTDMTLDNNPLECGFDRFMKLGKDAEYMSRDALDRIAAEGIRKKLVNLVISGSAHEGPRDVARRLGVVDDVVRQGRGCGGESGHR